MKNCRWKFVYNSFHAQIDLFYTILQLSMQKTNAYRWVPQQRSRISKADGMCIRLPGVFPQFQMKSLWDPKQKNRGDPTDPSPAHTQI